MLDPADTIPDPRTWPPCPRPCADHYIDRGLCNCWAPWPRHPEGHQP